MSSGVTLSVIAGLAVGIAFIGLLGIMMAVEMNNDFDSKFARHEGEIMLSFDMNNNETQASPETLERLNRIGNILNNCENNLIQLEYSSGSMKAAIEGMDVNGLCQMAIVISYHEFPERGEKLECSVPPDAISKWFGWMNRAVPAADEISDYCTEVGK